MVTKKSRGKRWVDQSPSYTLIASELARLFPDAQFLHIVRDGRRVVNSMIRSGFEEPWASDLPAEFFRTTRVNSSYHEKRLKKSRGYRAPRDPWTTWTATQRRIFVREAGDLLLDLGYGKRADLETSVAPKAKAMIG